MREYLRFFEDDIKRRWSLSRGYLSDGLLICLMKVVFLPWLVYYLFFLALVLLLSPAAWLIAKIGLKIGLFRSSPATPKGLPRLIFWLAQDLYMLLIACLMVVAYLWAFDDAAAPNRDKEWSTALVAACGLGVVRLYEIFGVIVQLHTKRIYATRAQMRALINTLWHYCEIVVAFAIFYVAAAAMQADTFGGGLLKSPENPIYFSLVTIATVGYGDLSPQSSVGKILVAVEVLLGVVLLLVVLQRVFAARVISRRPKRCGETASPRDPADGASGSRRLGEGDVAVLRS